MSTSEPDDLLLFTPVSAQRVTAAGWSSEVQRAFIQNLSKCGVVTTAARSVGRTARSAWMLRRRVGAEGFAAAWDMAVEMARDEALGAAITRAHAPERVPILWRGAVVAWREKFDDRLVMAALNAAAARDRGRRLPPPRRRAPAAPEAPALPPLPPAAPSPPTVVFSPVVLRRVRAAAEAVRPSAEPRVRSL